MKEYFLKKEYLCLYLSKFFYTLGNALIEIFGTVMLYKNGMPIYMILLVYGFRFGLMGACSPLFIIVSKKLGIAMCSLLANVLRIIASYMILTSSHNNIILFILVMGLPGSLSNPIEDAVSCKYVKTENRGKYNSIRNIMIILANAIASSIVAWGVLNNTNNTVFIAVTIFFLLDCLFILMINYKPQVEHKNAFKKTMNYILHKKSPLKTIYSLRTFHIIERLFLPLYVYIALEDFKLFSTVIIVSLIIQIIPVFIIGRTTDKNIQKTSNLVTILKAIVSGMFIFAKSKFAIALNKTINDNLEKAYHTNVQTSIQNITKNEKEDNALLSTIGQMCLCFTEIIVLILLAIIAKFIDVEIFKVLFVLSVIATILINCTVKKTYQK